MGNPSTRLRPLGCPSDNAVVSSPSSRSQILRQLAPFVAVQLVAFASLALDERVAWTGFWTALAFTVLAPWVAALTPRGRLRGGGARLVAAVMLLGAAAVLRDASGGAGSGISVLALLPVFWVALHGDRTQLVLVLAAVGAFFVLPVVLIGGEAYPVVGLRTAALFLATGAIVGLTVQQLVDEVRRRLQLAQAHEAEMAVLADEREEMSNRLRTLAVTDALTGVGNRRAWDGWLAVALGAEAPGRAIVALLDLDHFKAYNDHYGHQRGDDLLTRAAGAWRAVLRSSDRLARYGGEEFAVLFTECSLADAEEIVERLRAATPDEETCSVGLAEWDGVESPDAVLARADSALYRAKAGGRDCVRVAAAAVAPLS